MTNNPTDDELLPCPFCGDDGHALCHGYCRPTEETKAFYVECACGCELWKDSEAEVIAAWNNRTLTKESRV